MTIRLIFDLASAAALAEYAAAAASHLDHPTGSTGPALLLSGDASGVRLSSTGLPALPALAASPGTSVRAAAVAGQRPPATASQDEHPMPNPATPLEVLLPLVEPVDDALLDLLRVGVTAGATVLIVHLSAVGVDIAVGRRRTRRRSDPNPD